MSEALLNATKLPCDIEFVNGSVGKGCTLKTLQLRVLNQGKAFVGEIERLRAENERLKAELAEAKKDAERYRWMRDSSVGPSQIWELLSDDCQPPIMTLKSMHELDAAIDEAMKGK